MSLTSKAALAGVGLCLAIAPAAAQATLPFTSTDGHLVLETLGQRLTLPPPDWVAGESELATIGEQVSTRFLEEDEQAHLEIYKRGEGEAFWSTLYGARLSARAQMPLTDFRNLVLNVYVQSCQPETVAVFQLEPDDGENLPPLGYACGAYRDDFTAFAGQGEVMVMGFYKSEAGLGMVYQEWRGDAFDASNPANWPVPADVVEARIAQFKTEISLTALD